MHLYLYCIKRRLDAQLRCRRSVKNEMSTSFKIPKKYLTYTEKELVAFTLQANLKALGKF